MTDEFTFSADVLGLSGTDEQLPAMASRGCRAGREQKLSD
jgi:hypothetical protein